MQPTLRIVTIAGERTSIRMERVFQSALDDIAAGYGIKANDIVLRIAGMIQAAGVDIALTKAVRAYVLSHYLRRHRVLLRRQAKPSRRRR